MSIEVRTTPRLVSLLGASLQHDPAKNYGVEIRSLLDRVWPVLKGKGVKNAGINWVIYEQGGRLFAGVEAPDADAGALGLERSDYRFDRYAVAKHIGPYHLLKVTCAAMHKSLSEQHLRTDWPMAEVYGHWTNDESKLETEIWMRLV